MPRAERWWLRARSASSRAIRCCSCFPRPADRNWKPRSLLLLSLHDAESDWFVAEHHARFTLPWRAGLSHMVQKLDEKGIVPPSTLDFSAHRSGARVGAEDVEDEPAQDGQVLRGV